VRQAQGDCGFGARDPWPESAPELTHSLLPLDKKELVFYHVAKVSSSLPITEAVTLISSKRTSRHKLYLSKASLCLLVRAAVCPCALEADSDPSAKQADRPSTSITQNCASLRRNAQEGNLW
jgi:hypothetical protein